MDLVIFIVLAALIVVIFKDFKSLIYFVGMVEIFLRVVTFVRTHIHLPEVSDAIAKYVPNSILDIFAKYSTGLFYEILCWGFVICFLFLDYYLLQYFMKKKH